MLTLCFIAGFLLAIVLFVAGIRLFEYLQYADMPLRFRWLSAFLLLCSTAFGHDPSNELTPLSEVTHTAVALGRWSDSATWDNGVPDSGSKVFVPPGLAVEIDGTSEALWCRVAGMLYVNRDNPTRPNFHTLIGTPGSWIDFGNPMQPVRSSCVVEWLPGPFLPGDWQKMSRGLLSTGQVTACGTEKTAWLAADPSVEIAVGGTSVTLESTPYRWNVGDEVLISGTDAAVHKPSGDWVREHYQTERVRITGVSGRVVQFSPPTKYRHWVWKTATFDGASYGMRFHVANLTRNVRFQSRDTITIENRGHIMLMKSGVPQPAFFGYCSLADMGRTDKSRSVTDPRLDPISGEMVPGSDANPRARYALHWHLVGPDAEPSRAEGIVVDGSPGWGLVNHQSNVHVSESICTGCFGSGFTTEHGNERGWFRRDFAALNRGQGDTITGTDDDHGRRGAGDWGSDGSGFWLQGPLVEVSDCVSCDNAGRGFAFFNEALNGWNQESNKVPEYLRYPIVIDSKLVPSELGKIYGSSGIPSGVVPQLATVARNQAYNNKMCVQVWNSNFDWRTRPATVVGRFTDMLLWGRGSQFHAEYCRQPHRIDGLTSIGDMVIHGKFFSYGPQAGCKVRFLTEQDVTRYFEIGHLGKFEAP